MTAGEIVREFIRRMETRDLDAALELLAEDVVYDNVPMAAVEGRQAARDLLAPLVAGASAVEWRIFRQAETGGLVMNERLDRFEIGGRWIEIPVAGVFEVRDDKISLWRDYFDMAGFQQQMAGG